MKNTENFKNTIGFIVHLDFVGDLNNDFENIQLRYGIFYKGDALNTNLKTQIVQTQFETSLKQKAIIKMMYTCLGTLVKIAQHFKPVKMPLMQFGMIPSSLACISLNRT